MCGSDLYDLLMWLSVLCGRISGRKSYDYDIKNSNLWSYGCSNGFGTVAKR